MENSTRYCPYLPDEIAANAGVIKSGVLNSQQVVLTADNGATWTESESKLISPCYQGFNGNNEGACEPAIEPLLDGRIWMLMRTQAGFLYQSYSSSTKRQSG